MLDNSLLKEGSRVVVELLVLAVERDLVRDIMIVLELVQMDDKYLLVWL